MDPFAILGLPRRFEIDGEELERRYRDLQRALHPDRHAQEAAATRRLSLGRAVEVNEAYRILRDEVARAGALLRLAGHAPAEHERADPELLMEVMELRESLAEARRAGDLARVRTLAAEVVEQRDRARAVLAAAFAAERHDEAARTLARIKYFARFLDEVAAIEDDALDGRVSTP